MMENRTYHHRTGLVISKIMWLLGLGIGTFALVFMVLRLDEFIPINTKWLITFGIVWFVTLSITALISFGLAEDNCSNGSYSSVNNRYTTYFEPKWDIPILIMLIMSIILIAQTTFLGSIYPAYPGYYIARRALPGFLLWLPIFFLPMRKEKTKDANSKCNMYLAVILFSVLMAFIGAWFFVTRTTQTSPLSKDLLYIGTAMVSTFLAVSAWEKYKQCSGNW
jgi:hypothetical protein